MAKSLRKKNKKTVKRKKPAARKTAKRKATKRRPVKRKATKKKAAKSKTPKRKTVRKKATKKKPSKKKKPQRKRPRKKLRRSLRAKPLQKRRKPLRRRSPRFSSTICMISKIRMRRPALRSTRTVSCRANQPRKPAALPALKCRWALPTNARALAPSSIHTRMNNITLCLRVPYRSISTVVECIAPPAVSFTSRPVLSIVPALRQTVM